LLTKHAALKRKMGEADIPSWLDWLPGLKNDTATPANATQKKQGQKNDTATPGNATEKKQNHTHLDSFPFSSEGLERLLAPSSEEETDEASAEASERTEDDGSERDADDEQKRKSNFAFSSDSETLVKIERRIGRNTTEEDEEEGSQKSGGRAVFASTTAGGVLLAMAMPMLIGI